MAIFTHVALGTNDLERSKRFYEATLAPLGVHFMGPMGDSGHLYGREAPELVVRKPLDGNSACHANGGTIGFAAASRAAVDGFHAAALANGGTCEGKPGPRSFTPTAYGAYVRDPDGNKLCAYSFVPA